MVNLPSLLDGRNCYRSEFHYIVYRELSETEPLNCQAVCVTYYHDDILSRRAYRELHLNNEKLQISSLISGKLKMVVPISQEEYYIRSQAFAEDKYVRFNKLHKTLVKPPNFMNTIWLSSVMFLTALLILIYHYDLFSKGLNLSVILTITVTLILTNLVAWLHAYIKSYLAIKIISAYVDKFNSERYINGVIVWLANDYGLLTETSIKNALAISSGADDLLEILSDIYEPCFDPNTIEARTVKLLNKLHAQ